MPFFHRVPFPAPRHDAPRDGPGDLPDDERRLCSRDGPSQRLVALVAVRVTGIQIVAGMVLAIRDAPGDGRAIYVNGKDVQKDTHPQCRAVDDFVFLHDFDGINHPIGTRHDDVIARRDTALRVAKEVRAEHKDERA